MANVFESLAQAHAAVAGSHPSCADILGFLRFVRVNRVRCPEKVVVLGSVALRKHERSLGDEKWTIYEQVFVAALDTGDDELANECLGELTIQFKDSARVKRLVGMSCEAQRQFRAARDVYDGLLATNAANALAAKRKVSILKAQGKIKEAIAELNEYTERTQTDVTAWQELSDLYLSISKIDSAAFCLEELILHDPLNHVAHCRLGEVYYTLGSQEIARKYFSQSLEIKKKGNARALFGLASCCQNMVAYAAMGTAATGRLDVTCALHDLARTELTALYRDSAMATIVDTTLRAQSDAIRR